MLQPIGKNHFRGERSPRDSSATISILQLHDASCNSCIQSKESHSGKTKTQSSSLAKQAHHSLEKICSKAVKCKWHGVLSYRIVYEVNSIKSSLDHNGQQASKIVAGLYTLSDQRADTAVIGTKASPSLPLQFSLAESFLYGALCRYRMYADYRKFGQFILSMENAKRGFLNALGTRKCSVGPDHSCLIMRFRFTEAATVIKYESTFHSIDHRVSM